MNSANFCRAVFTPDASAATGEERTREHRPAGWRALQVVHQPHHEQHDRQHQQREIAVTGLGQAVEIDAEPLGPREDPAAALWLLSFSIWKTITSPMKASARVDSASGKPPSRSEGSETIAPTAPAMAAEDQRGDERPCCGQK